MTCNHKLLKNQEVKKLALVAVTSAGSQRDSNFEVRFGRSPYFILFKEGSDKLEGVPNPGVEAEGGAGVKAVQFLMDQGVKKIITGKVGPHAKSALQEGDIEVYEGTGDKVEEVIGKYNQGRLQRLF
ncbi:MAG: dinitrogenase iron-molybdenum cofactor biosynthesis protein [Candidatus Syntrophonatronum acetioxidans]|uniref:Dinitrogenase iron-molybdenum cofactor biosynthesis protein n=1 Tax=Candidatus Syntrophonatronum acetioxidans TaxID=1795816 RepID=A0A424YE25_9FIRM|nr:MAG: dinitrogenase iron-molybdenum cofactor biosynthesis protein [Candidatus Syntrophonatronum acetioxidans]